MRWVVDNYETASEFAMKTAPAIHSEYDWDSLTAAAFSALEDRLKK